MVNIIQTSILYARLISAILRRMPFGGPKSLSERERLNNASNQFNLKTFASLYPLCLRQWQY